MTLQQTGPKVIGDVSLGGWNAGPFSGPIEGTVTGDALKFSRADRADLRGEAIVAGDALTGTVTFGMLERCRSGSSGSPAGTPRAADRISSSAHWLDEHGKPMATRPCPAAGPRRPSAGRSASSTCG